VADICRLTKEVIMKTAFLTLFAIIGLATIGMAQQTETLTIKRGQQKKAADSGITLKFVSVLEDSRCPTDVNCIWEGNAKIEVIISDKNGGSKKSVMNTTSGGPLGDQHNGWAIYLTSLTPLPKGTKATKQKSYVATFNITRLFR